MSVNVIGAGLAGCEAAWQISRQGVHVDLYDMKPSKFSPAHKSKNFAELVCSNSFKASRLDSAAGLLKEELRRMGSCLMECADKCTVPAGGALAVDREKFSQLVTQRICENNLISVHEKEIVSVPEDRVTVVATGPLTSETFAICVKNLCGNMLSFYDAAAPIVTVESIDMENAFAASRYGKGDGSDYLNCPLNKEEYELFYSELKNAKRAKLHDFDEVYEDCMPIEVMAMRGKDTMRFGPMKPVGLRDPRTGERPWAVLQLRKENTEGSMYNLVGCQTNLTFAEQKRVFGIIPALKNADFIRYGVMHRNTFLNSPKLLDGSYRMRLNKNLFFAGQITGVEGYMESVSSGLVAGINAARVYNGEETIKFPAETMIGALSEHVCASVSDDFQPMGANFGIIPVLNPHIKDKRERYMAFSIRSLDRLQEFKLQYSLT